MINTFIGAIPDFSEAGNFLDGLIHDFLAAFYIILPCMIIGYIIGWILWRNCKKKCAEIEAENARIRAKQRTA